MDTTTVTNLGALCFGIVIGYITHRTLARTTSAISDIATIIGAIGGAVVLALFPQQSALFGHYCIGLALGFFIYLILWMLLGEKRRPPWMRMGQ